MVLPPLYQKWMDELLPDGIEPETRATCGECAMVDRGGADAPDVPFNPAVKCCTYHPDLPNFLVGRILADGRPELAQARAVLEERLESGVGLTPYGLHAPAAYTLVYNNAAAFGRAEGLRCPFYVVDGGGCGIYTHREGVCATFYCKHARAAAGRAFWRVMNAFLKGMEMGLRAWCLEQIDGGGETATNIWMLEMTRGKENLDEFALAGVRSGEYAWLWGRWAGKEAELYRRCGELVEGLTLERVLEICGSMARAASRVVTLVHASLRAAQPAQVMLGGGLVQIGRRPGAMRISNGATPYDFVDVPIEVLAAVPRLTQGPLAQAVAALRAEGVPLDDRTLRWLLDFEVVVPTAP